MVEKVNVFIIINNIQRQKEEITKKRNIQTDKSNGGEYTSCQL